MQSPTPTDIYAIVKQYEPDNEIRGLLLTVVSALSDRDLGLMGMETSEVAIMAPLRAHLPGVFAQGRASEVRSRQVWGPFEEV